MENANLELLVPPSAIDLEQAVLGACMVDNNGLFDVVGILKTPDAFYKEEHKYIFQAILELFTKNEPVDILTVSQKLKKIGKLKESGGDFYLVGLTQKIASSAHSEYHSRIILQKYIARNIIKFNNTITQFAYSESTDVFELISKWSAAFDSIADLTTVGRTTMQWKPSLQQLKENVEELSKHDGEFKMVGIPTGFKRIDRFTGGYREQDLIILGARPGMGKTAKVLKTAIENLKIDNPVGMISGEMSMKQLTARCFAIESSFHLNQLMKHGFEKAEYFVTMQAFISKIENWPLFVDDSGNMDVSDVIIKIKDWYRKYKIKLAIIDYMQLMKDRSRKWNNRSDELLDISRRLKLLAKELDIVIIALAQVNRECEKRGSNKRPQVIDIKDCGAIEQDADIIEFIYRPSEYGLEMDYNEYSSKLQLLIDKGANAEIIFAKYRGGSKETTLLKWVGNKTKFVDVMDEEDTVEYISSDYQELPKPSAKEAFDVNDTNELPEWLK